jgi:hypothetical protein
MITLAGIATRLGRLERSAPLDMGPPPPPPPDVHLVNGDLVVGGTCLRLVAERLRKLSAAAAAEAPVAEVHAVGDQHALELRARLDAIVARCRNCSRAEDPIDPASIPTA